MNCRIAALCLGSCLAQPALAQSVKAPSFDTPVWRSHDPFTSIYAVRELRSGQVLVSDTHDQVLRLLDGSGNTLREVGRVGGGPAEFKSPGMLIPIRGDSTWLSDQAQRRFLVLDPDARPVATVSFPSGDGLDGLVSARGSDRNGNLLLQTSWLADPSSKAEPIVALLRWNRRANRLDTLGRIRPPKPVVRTGGTKEHSTMMQLFLPFTPQDDWAVGSDGSIAVLRHEGYRVEWIHSDGAKVSGPPTSFTPVPVTAADKTGNFDFPSEKPPFMPGTLVIDPVGRLWVQRYGATGAAKLDWDVFDGAGKRIGTIRLDRNRQIVAFGPRLIYVIYTDSDEQEWLEAYAR